MSRPQRWPEWLFDGNLRRLGRGELRELGGGVHEFLRRVAAQIRAAGHARGWSVSVSYEPATSFSGEELVIQRTGLLVPK